MEYGVGGSACSLQTFPCLFDVTSSASTGNRNGCIRPHGCATKKSSVEDQTGEVTNHLDHRASINEASTRDIQRRFQAVDWTPIRDDSVRWHSQRKLRANALTVNVTTTAMRIPINVAATNMKNGRGQTNRA